MARESVGIYISAKYVDIVQLAGSPGSPRLKNFIREEIASPPLTPSVEIKEDSEQRQISHRESVSFAIREGFKKMNIRSASVNAVLPTNDVMIRYFSMPIIPKSEQEQAVKFEVRKYIPFKVDKLISDFKVLPSGSKAKRSMDVFFIAATKDNINSHIDLLKNANADAVGVDIIPFALLKTLVACRKVSPKDNAAVLYIDNDRMTASIHITEKGIPFLSRDIRVTAEDKEAFFEKVVSEIRVSLDYYHRQRPQIDVTKLILCGEMLYDGLDKAISDELKMFTETLEGLAAIKGAEKLSPSFAISIGAAIGGLGKSYFSVNLSPVAAAKEKRKIANIIFMEAAAAVGLILLVFIATSINSARLWTRLQALRGQQKDVLPQLSSVDHESLKALNRNVAEELAFLEDLLSDRISWTEIMETLAKNLPDDMWLTSFEAGERIVKASAEGYSTQKASSLSIMGNSFSFEGSGSEIERISSFHKALKEDANFARFFDKVELGPIERSNIREYTVSSFRINASEGKPKKRQ